MVCSHAMVAFSGPPRRHTAEDREARAAQPCVSDHDTLVRIIRPPAPRALQRQIVVSRLTAASTQGDDGPQKATARCVARAQVVAGVATK